LLKNFLIHRRHITPIAASNFALVLGSYSEADKATFALKKFAYRTRSVNTALAGTDGYVNQTGVCRTFVRLSGIM
jgi:hypothetical protein